MLNNKREHTNLFLIVRVGTTFIMQKYNEKALLGVVLKILVAYESRHVEHRTASSGALLSRRPNPSPY